MRKALYSIAAAVCVVAGCATLPSVQRMESIATLVGSAAGIVANASSMNAETRAAVVEIVTTASAVVPGTNETFAVAWTPIAREYVNTAVSGGKLTQESGVLVMYAFTLATDGLDYLVDVRYPKVSAYEDVMAAAVKGFSAGFLSVFADPELAEMMKGSRAIDYDEEALEYLRHRGR